MNKESGIDAVLTGSLVKSRHVLFLYTSNVNRYAVQSSFFAMLNQGEKLLYVTGERPELIMNRFLDTELSVIPWENISNLKTMGGSLRIIIDGASWHGLMNTPKMDEELRIHQILEEYITANKNSTVLCTYDLSKLEPERIQKLAASHDRLILNTPDLTLLSGGKLYEDTSVERFVKDYLDIVVLALIASKPRCGIDIQDIVHRKFNVLLSPGTIYPLLHRLKKEGLLECECGIKKKVYKPAKGNEMNIQRILDEHSLANELLNDFLKSRSMEGSTA